MAETHLLDDPWRDRADEIRCLAEQMSDPQTRSTMRNIADIAVLWQRQNVARTRRLSASLRCRFSLLVASAWSP
jgi:hypothetical protein